MEKKKKKKKSKKKHHNPDKDRSNVQLDLLDQSGESQEDTFDLFSKDSNEKTISLTDEERGWVQQGLVKGIGFFFKELKWNRAKTQSFLGRRGVREELVYLKHLYSERDKIQERTMFFQQQRVNTMVPSAVTILARALRGDFEDPNTHTLQRAPSRGQFEAAVEILNRSNIGGKFTMAGDSPSIDARSVTINAGDEGLEGPQGEKVRKFMTSLIARQNAGKDKKRQKKKKDSQIIEA